MPFVLGGPTASTEFKVIASDSSMNFVIGGSSSDLGVLDATSAPNPIALFINYGG